METKIIPLSTSAIAEAADLLKQGIPVVFPTETVYGLGALLFDKEAINKIFMIKNRPFDNPLIAHVASLEQALSLCCEPPPQLMVLVEKFWPGPLTVVLKRDPKIPPAASAGQTIAIRLPSHPAALELIRAVGQPLVAPSANLSGRPSPTNALDAWEDLQGKIPLILDGGDCEIGIESTVISLVNPEPVLLRPGSIPQEKIEKELQKKLSLLSSEGPIHSPGMKYRHYAPKAEVKLVNKREELEGPFILSSDPRPGEKLLTFKTLYAAFREADRLGIKRIEIDCTHPSLLKNKALMNRLSKAANLDIQHSNRE